eukprot:19093-Eustigmatos_ZCMA.PRE.1
MRSPCIPVPVSSAIGLRSTATAGTDKTNSHDLQAPLLSAPIHSATMQHNDMMPHPPSSCLSVFALPLYMKDDLRSNCAR